MQDRTLSKCIFYTLLGRIAYLHMSNDPSWIPTLHLGYETQKVPDGARYERSQKRHEKRKDHEAATSLMLLQTSDQPNVEPGLKRR